MHAKFLLSEPAYVFRAIVVAAFCLAWIGVANAGQRNRYADDASPPRVVPADVTAGARGATALGTRSLRNVAGAPQMRRMQPRQPSDFDDDASALPTFKRSFTYHDKTYIERFVGTDPSGPAQTTFIDAVLVPIRFDFGNGVVRDAAQDVVNGRTPLQWVLQSPLFQPAPMKSGSTLVGTLQWGDSYLRANFWDELQDKPDYHVLLRPRVHNATFNVPLDKVSFEPESSVIIVDSDWWYQQLLSTLAEIDDPSAVVIFVQAQQVLFGDV